MNFEQMGITPEWIAWASGFVLLHVQAVKGFFPAIATRPGARLLAVVFSGMFLALEAMPEIAVYYYKFAAPLIGSAGLWKTGTQLIGRKA